MNNFDYLNTGITYAGAHSKRDYDLVLKDAPIIGFPSKIKTEKKPPYSNETHDFSLLYGHQPYTDRTLEVTFIVYDRRIHDEYEIQLRKINAVNWLMREVGRQPLMFDHIEGFYFKAEVVSQPKFTSKKGLGLLTVTFIAYPFKIDLLSEQDKQWFDELILPVDWIQKLDYVCEAGRVIDIVNPGTSHRIPSITCSIDNNIWLRHEKWQINAGTHTYNNIVLAPEHNFIEVEKACEISFDFNKELI